MAATQEIIALIGNIAQEENLRATVTGAARGGAAACVGAVAGCLIAGPWGGVPGAAIGAAIGASTGNNYKPLWRVIAEWPEDKKQQLAENIRRIMRQVDARDIAALTAMAAGAAPAVRAQIVAAVISFCQNTMRVEMAQR